MTPKNKAKDLIKKFTITADDSNGMYYMDIATKEKALIAVDEIVNSHDYLIDFFEEAEDYRKIEIYWIEVKKEIEKL
jgi:hypothetical protein